MDRSKKACNCRDVTYGQIEDAVKAGATTFAEVQERTGCARGCGRCKEFIAYLVQELVEAQNSEERTTP